MALLEPQLGIGSITGVHQTGDDHRLTGTFMVKHPGTTGARGYYTHTVPARYAASDGTVYTDTIPATTPALVWTPDPTTPDDPRHVGNYAYTLALAKSTFDNHAARWKVFAPAMYGGVTHLFVARSCDFDAATSDLATYIPALVPANREGDILALEYIFTAGQARRLQLGGCDMCGSGAGRIPLQLVAGLPDLVDPRPGLLPATDPEEYVPAPGYDDAGGDPFTAKLAGPSSLLRTADGTFYIGCSPYTSAPTAGPIDHAASGTIRRINAGVLDTVAGIGDISLLGNPPGTVYPHTGAALAAQLDVVSALLFDEDTQEMTLHGLLHKTLTTTGSANGLTPEDFSACTLQLRGTLTWATTESNHGTLTSIGVPGATLTMHPHTWEMIDTGSPWLAMPLGGPDGPASLAYTFGTSLQRTSTGRLLSDGVAAVSGTAHFEESGDVDFFRIPASAVARIDDISTPTVVDMVWRFETILQELNGTSTFPHCIDYFLFPLKSPRQMWLDQTGPVPDRYLYVACAGNNQIRLYDLVTNTFTLLVGDAGEAVGFGGDGQSIYTDPATLAPGDRIVLHGPSGVCLDSRHRLVIADTGNGCIRRVDLATGIITTIAGIGGHPGYHQWQPDPTGDTDGAIVPETALKLGQARKTQISPTFLLPGKNCGIYFCADQRVLFLGCGKPLAGGA